MINSMTGYGYAEGQFDDVIYAVEIRSVNSRYFKARIRVPEMFGFLEEDIDRLLRDSLSRGTVSCVIRPRSVPVESLYNIDESALKSYMGVLKKAADSVDVDSTIDIAALMALPGVVLPALIDEQKALQLKEKILEITEEAAGQVRQMRAAEGAALAADLQAQCEAMKEQLTFIRENCDDVLKGYRDKLKRRIDELLSEGKLKIDEATLAREVAVFADRSDISEELARLGSHLERFNESCQSGGQSGRRLDFISQEMLREANTIASKAFDMEIINRIVEIKCRIDRIKEQVQNIE